MKIEDLNKNNNLLLYKYLRGSWSHGIAIEGKSDYDYGGVWAMPQESLLGLRSSYIEQVADDKNDEVYYEIGRWFELLLKSNPTALESIFIDKNFIVGDIHPAIQHIIDNKEIFLTKEAFAPLLGYSFNQIKKATGYNKKCNYPENMRRKGILDFCFVPYGYGSKNVEAWLAENGLKQNYCGLVNIPNMHDTYGLCYDWGAHIICEYGINLNDKNATIKFNKDLYEKHLKNNNKFIEAWETFNSLYWNEDIEEFLEIVKPCGFKGIVNPNEDSNHVRVSSTPKDILPLIYMSFNQSGYESHCRDYNSWSEWKKNRNEQRFSDNKGYNFDAKNMCETVRLIHTGIELAKGEGFNVTRTWDRDFLLDIKFHKKSYNEIMKYINEKKNEFDELVKTCKLPEKINENDVNKLLISARKKIYN